MTAPAPAGSEGAAQAKLEYLSEADLFQDLSRRQLEDVGRSMTVVSVPRHQQIFTPGETGEVLFILKSGLVNLYRQAADGRKIVVATIGPGTVFGEMSLIAADMADSAAETVEDSTMCMLSRSEMVAILERYPSVAVRLLERVAQRLMSAEQRLADMAYQPLNARIAGALLRFTERDQVVRLSHQDIAEIVGAQRETVTRVLREMREHGVIEASRMKVAVKDRDALAAIARATPQDATGV